MKKKKHAPAIGFRIIKSAVSVGICFLIFVLRGYRGIPFYTALATLQCMQPYRESTKKIAVQRIIGTMIGAFYGLIIIFVQQLLLAPNHLGYLFYGPAVSLGVVGSLYTAVVLHKKNAAYFSCVVFLSITMNHIGDENPYIFVLNRVIDTLIGVAVGMLINAWHLPVRKNREVLFVTAMDDVLLSRTSSMSDYGKVVLNRMLDEGIPFSIMTMRTPASFLEAASDIHVRLPLILMDGAALYDPRSNSFLAKRELSYTDAIGLMERLAKCGVSTFQNVIIDDSVMIFYQQITSEGAREVFERLRKSPHRNYIQRPLPVGEPVAYLMAMDKKDRIDRAYEALAAAGDTERFKVLYYDSDEYPGYSYLKLYRKDATKLAMLETLKQVTGFQRARTFGSIPDVYDEYIPDATGDEVVRRLRREFEPYLWRRNPLLTSSQNDCTPVH